MPCLAAFGRSSRLILFAFLSSQARCSSSAFLAASSITGPTSVVELAGSPTVSASIAPAIIAIMRSATSSWTNSTRKAEQRWPALWKADEMTSRVTCSGRAELSTIIAFWPPVSAMNGMIGPSRSASVRLIMRAVSVEPVKTTPASSGCAVSVPPTTLPSPGASWTTSLGNARLVHQLDRERADQRRLPGRLGNYGIARSERRRRPGR